MTRDRVAYDALWSGRRFTLVDTGGWEPDAARAAGDGVGAGRAGGRDRRSRAVRGRRPHRRDRDRPGRRPHAAPRPSARWCSPSPRSTTSARESDAAELWSLGLGEPYPVSGLHGRGSGDLLDAVLDALPDAPPRDATTRAARAGWRWSGGPNVGKSSLLNRLTGEERSVVDAVAGTTIDPVDSLVELGGEVWRFVDTAGLRRRVHQASGMEYYASLRTAAAIEAAEVAVVLLDASERAQRAGPAGHRRGRRRRPGAGARVQQVGPASTRTAG